MPTSDANASRPTRNASCSKWYGNKRGGGERYHTLSAYPQLGPADSPSPFIPVRALLTSASRGQSEGRYLDSGPLIAHVTLS